MVKSTGNFGSTSFSGDMLDVLMEFPPKLKQAMYAAANKGIIRRGTWDGCAFNRAGIEDASTPIFNTSHAARMFGITEATVKQFIIRWDTRKGTDVECTEWLKELILQAGLFTRPGENMPRIISRKVFKSEKAQFEEIMAAGEVPDVNIELAEQLMSVYV